MAAWKRSRRFFTAANTNSATALNMTAARAHAAAAGAMTARLATVADPSRLLLI